MQTIKRVAGAVRPAAAVSRKIARVHAAADCAFLALVTVASLVLYVGHLGFYYDDYSVLARMSASHDQSLLGLYHSVRPATGQRPLQALTFATLYRVFGVHPLGYHVSNACLIIAVAGLLYLVLRELRLPRLVCVAVPLVYSTLPHYATDRFWLDAFQVNVSSAFYLLSLYAGLRAVRASLPALGAWLPLAAIGIAASLSAYEVVFPLFALNVGLVWWSAGSAPQGEVDRRAVWITVGTLTAVALVIGLAKAALIAEHGQNSYRIGLQDGLLHHLAYLVSGSIKLNVGTYLVAFPYVLWWIFRHNFSGPNAVAAGIAGSFALAYLWHIGRREPDPFEMTGIWRTIVGVGLLAFVLGYAVFLTNQNILFRSAGIDDRVNAGAAIGVAGVLVGAIGWLAGRLDARRRVVAFSAAVACAVAGGVFVVDTLASNWTSAARRQRVIVTNLGREARSNQVWNTVILDGTCPENGPAVVFADEFDLAGALQLRYQNPSLRADVATEAVRATPRGLALDMTFLGRLSTRTYPYGLGLVIYDSVHHRLYRLLDRRRAADYVAHSRPSFRCPPQRSFAWGFDPSRRWSLL